MRTFSRIRFRALTFLLASACSRGERETSESRLPDSTTTVAAADTLAPPRAFAVPPSSHNVACEPAELRGRDTLTVRMTGPHGASLHVIAPDGTLYLVVFHGEGERDRGNRRSLIPPDSFARLQLLHLDPRTLTAGPWVFGRDTNEVLFRAPGFYRLIVGSDLETDGPVYAECVVRYVP